MVKNLTPNFDSLWIWWVLNYTFISDFRVVELIKFKNSSFKWLFTVTGHDEFKKFFVAQFDIFFLTKLQKCEKKFFYVFGRNFWTNWATETHNMSKSSLKHNKFGISLWFVSKRVRSGRKLAIYLSHFICITLYLTKAPSGGPFQPFVPSRKKPFST